MSEHAKKIVYLDNAATTPMDPLVLEEYAARLKDCYGNPSSLHPPGIHAARVLGEARELLCGLIGARRILFTGGGTEATNLAFRGTLRGKKGRMLVGAADHPATMRTAEDLAREDLGLSVYPVDEKGQPRLDAFGELLDEELRFVSILYGNNEVASLAPLGPMIALVRERAPRALVHVDVVQSFAKVPVDLDRMDADFMTIAAHKIHGPKGVGALAIGHRGGLVPQLTGGGQEGGLRSGTENVVGNAAFAHAAELWISRMAEESGRIEAMRNRMEARLLEEIDGLRVLGDPERRLPNILSVSISGCVGEVLMHHLEQHGICVSTGSACSQKGGKKVRDGSSTLDAMGLDRETVRGALRISLGRLSKDSDVDALLEELPRAAKKLRALGL